MGSASLESILRRTGVGLPRRREAGVDRAARPGRGSRHGARVGRRLVGRRTRSGRAAQHVLLEVVGELAEQLARHVGHHTPAELRHLAGDVEVGVDVDGGRGIAVGHQGGDDGRGGVALSTRVAALGLQHHLAVGLVGLFDLGHALVLRGDGTDLDLHRAAVLVALHLGELRAGEAGGDALEVEQDLPGLFDGHFHPEAVFDLHWSSCCSRSRSSRVSTSAALPVSVQSTQIARHGRASARAPRRRHATPSPRARGYAPA